MRTRAVSQPPARPPKVLVKNKAPAAEPAPWDNWSNFEIRMGLTAPRQSKGRPKSRLALKKEPAATPKTDAPKARRGLRKNPKRASKRPATQNMAGKGQEASLRLKVPPK